MKTTKPISTISYNSPGYLKGVLDTLRKNKIIEFYAFIKHVPEDDETKSHIHVYVEPAKLLQTLDLEDEFKEFDPSHPDKPFGVVQFKSSKFGDWYYYALHDRAYLATKQQSRKHHYSADQIVSSDSDTLAQKVQDIDLLSVSPYLSIVNAYTQGLTFEQYFRSGVVPIAQIRNYREAWYLIVGDETDRNGRDGHDTFNVDETTGEVDGL